MPEMADPSAGSLRTARTRRAGHLLLGVIATAVVLVLLVQARFFLIPLAIAILLFSLTSALNDRVARLRLGSLRVPAWLASVVSVTVIAATLLALFGVVSAQINDVLATVPSYARRAEEAVAALFAWLGADVAQSVLAAFQDIDVGSWMRAAAGSAGNLLTAIVLIILYVGFLFAERPRFEAKLRRLFPQPERARRVSHVVESISRSVHHYMLVKTAISLVTGIVVYALLVMFGLDFAEALAVFTFVLNFIPNLGSIVATALPVVVAMVQFEGWPPVIALLAAVGSAQFLLGNVVEPMLMGRTLQMSSFAIVISLTLWGAIWGVVGMFLAVPIMVTVMIVCAHIAPLRPLAVLLSRDGAPIGEERDEAAELRGTRRPLGTRAKRRSAP